jgi:hypothetical protein
METKLVNITIVYFDVTDQLRFRYSAFVRHAKNKICNVCIT